MAKIDTPAKGAGAGAAGMAAMLAIAVPFTGGWEGKRNDPYWDAIGKVTTVCYGETAGEMRRYSDAECDAKLKTRLERDFAPVVADALPGVADKPYAFAAFTDLAYNAGTGSVKGSIAKLWGAGDYVGACRAIRNFKYGGGKVVAGLVYRREGQGKRIGAYELCLVDAVPMQLGGK